MSEAFRQAEVPVLFSCEDQSLLGITHCGDSSATRGVLIVVGGPQYRVGSHRQFLLLARGLANQGIPVFRFDCRGMGDSEGDFPGFDAIDHDIKSAIDAFCESVPSVKEVVIWGLCDGASAASFYAPEDDRVAGLVLVNPWIRTEQGEAKAYLKHYYLSRLLSKDFWGKVVSGKFDLGGSFQSLLSLCSRLLPRSVADHDSNDSNTSTDAKNSLPLPERFYQSLKAFTQPVLFIFSGHDLTAAEFLDVVNSERRWKALVNEKIVRQEVLPDADHTFSKRESMDEVIVKTLAWLKAY